MRTESSAENIQYWLDLHGHVPWTVTIAESLSKGIPWEESHIIETLQRAQDTIDKLTEKLKEKNT
jgi:hypothetical protein